MERDVAVEVARDRVFRTFDEIAPLVHTSLDALSDRRLGVLEI